MTLLAEALKKISKNLEAAGWVKCPLCHEDWNKLHPCSYLDNGQTVGTYVCVTCAESIQSIHKVFEILKVDAFINPPMRKKPYDDLAKTYGDHFDNPRAFKVRVESAKPIVTAWIESDGVRLMFHHVEAKATQSFGNIFQCASYFKNLVKAAAQQPAADDKKGRWR